MGMKKTVLIFGISSFVGSNLAQLLGDEYRVIGTYHQTPVNIPGVTCVPCDVLKKDYVFKLVAIFKPDFTIYAAGLSSLSECDRFPKRADALNSAGAVNCTVASERFGSKFIYISSCYVLGGEDIMYKESDTPFPTTVYGTSLSSTEFYIQRSCLNYLILRSSPLYGRGYNPGRPTWFEMLQSACAKGTSFGVDDAVATGFLDITLFAKILKTLMALGVTNKLLQVSSNNSMTRFEFARAYARVFHHDEGIIQPTSGTFPVDTGPRKTQQRAVASNQFYKLDVANLEGILGVRVPTVEDSLRLTHQRFNARV